MPTIQHFVRAEMENNPFLIDMMQQELVNISALALRLQPGIERAMGRKAKASAIGMALRRYASGISQKPIFEWEFPPDLEFSTRSQIYEVAIERTPEAKRILDELYAHVRRRKGEFLSFVEGTYEIAIFTNRRNKARVKAAIKGQKVTSECDRLSYITVNWESDTKEIPGIYYRISRALAFRGIPIQSLHTIGAEMMLLFKEEDFKQAHAAISDLLQNHIKI